jgi:hypothetical protein
MENHHFSWVNPLFQWPWLAMAGIVFSMFTGGYPFLVLDPTTKKKIISGHIWTPGWRQDSGGSYGVLSRLGGSWGGLPAW